MDRKQIIQAKYKDSERLRTAARATSEFYEEISHIIENTVLPNIRERKQLAIIRLFSHRGYEIALAYTVGRYICGTLILFIIWVR